LVFLEGVETSLGDSVKGAAALSMLLGQGRLDYELSEHGGHPEDGSGFAQVPETRPQAVVESNAVQGDAYCSLTWNADFMFRSQVAVSDELYHFIHDLWLENQPIGELS
jgi:hypothetical protein